MDKRCSRCFEYLIFTGVVYSLRGAVRSDLIIDIRVDLIRSVCQVVRIVWNVDTSSKGLRSGVNEYNRQRGDTVKR